MKKKTRKIALLVAITLGIGLSATVGGLSIEKTHAQPVCEEGVALETAVLKQGAKGGEVKEVQRRLKIGDIITEAWTAYSAQARKKR